MLSLNKAPSYFRTSRAEVASKPTIDMTGGMFGAGIIRGVSVITQGEALGHGLWIDSEFIASTAEQLSAAGTKGIKSRFTHPGMSSDGLGRHLGRLNNAKVEGDKVIADLHFSKSAHDTPDGNLAEYVAALVSEDSSAAGLSIVFERDTAAEEAFTAANETSPDPANTNNLQHARLAKLRAADLVDEPAANPDGMFDSMPVAREVDKALSYALGLSKDNPGNLLGVDCDRAAAFLSRFLLSKGLEIVTKDTKTEPVAPTREQFNAELSRFAEKFGAANGTKWFTEGKSFEEALSLHCDVLIAERDAALKSAAEAQSKLASAELGEKEPLDVAGTTPPGKKKTLAEFTGVVASRN